MNPPVLVVVIYRPPKIAFLKIVELINSLRTLSGNYSHKIIIGDLNADLLRVSHDAKLVRHLAAELSLVQHGLTHFNPASGTWIDMIFIDDKDTIINDRNIPANFHSKHNIIDVTMKISTTVTKISAFTYRDYIRKLCQKNSPRNCLAVIEHPLMLTSLIPSKLWTVSVSISLQP